MRKNKNNTTKNVIAKKVLLTRWMKKVKDEIHLYIIFKDIMSCFMMSFGLAFLLIFFYWEEATSLPLSRSTLMKLANSSFLMLLIVLSIFRISTDILTKNKKINVGLVIPNSKNAAHFGMVHTHSA